ncbi:Hcp family type VI secretion system effector [Sphingomonas sp.]|uniref:Hcp family type VI secretion system effector n=1 Tax=Sphingomonas sp. TaxID=28214 RepID=UPI003CC6C603
MATDFFLKIDGIPGEATATHGKGQIDVHSMTFGVSQPAAIGRTGSGLSTGKASFGDIHFTKFTDKSSAMLYQVAGTGRHIPTAIFTGFKGTDTPTLYFTVTLSDVLITSFQNSGAGGSEMTEQISFGYSKIEFEYKEINAQGGVAGTNRAGFNVREGGKV